MITVTRSGPDIEAAMARAARAAPAICERVAETAVELIAGRARQIVPSCTGRARSSIRADRTTVSAGGPRAPYFGWLDYGGKLREQNISRPYRPGGRYVYPAAGDVWPKVLRALDDGAADIIRASGLGG